MQAEMEITKKKEEVKSDLDNAKETVKDGANAAVKDFRNKAVVEGTRLQMAVENAKKDLENSNNE